MKLLAETTGTSVWYSVRSKMKLFTKVINSLKAVTHKVHKENASIFKIEIIATCLVVFYYCPGVAPITKHTHKKKLPFWKNDSPKSNEMSKVKIFTYRVIQVLIKIEKIMNRKQVC